jgi:protein-S-isoprenylcysteine O-methyltransferase Ste14
MKKKSFYMVLVQVIAMLYLTFTIRLAGLNLFPIFLISLGLSVGIAGSFYLRKSKISLFPEVYKETKLITDGIYKIIRHPLYTAVLLITFGLLLTDLELLRIIFFAFLVVDIMLKIRREEMLLTKKFPQYKEYAEKSYKLIPYVF